MPSIGLGESIPPDTAHAVSVSLPTWDSNVGYEEGASWVMSRLVTGYPRFFIHNSIKAFAASIADRYGRPGQLAILFPSRRAAARCVEFVQYHFYGGADAKEGGASPALSIVHLALDPAQPAAAPFRPLAPTISAVLLPSPEAFAVAKQYWQHSGDGISSRRAEYCHKLFTAGLLVRVDETDATGTASARGGSGTSTAATSGVVPAVATPTPTPTPPAASPMKAVRGPKRYRRPMSPTASTTAAPATTPITTNGRPVTPQSPSGANGATTTTSDLAEDEDSDETARYLEERFGRNLDLSFVRRATSAIRRRITGALTADNDVELERRGSLSPPPPPPPADVVVGNGDGTGTAPTAATHFRGVAAVREEDVYLFPCGMNAVFHAHLFLLAARPDARDRPCINFGFPYVDTLKILQKFGSRRCLFYGHASDADLDDLEARLRAGERFLALVCEFPGNPLLTCPDLARIRRLADAYDFAVVVDETIGTFANVNVLPFADVVVSSLTKIFSGDCNVMGGSLVLNAGSRYYDALRTVAGGGGGSGGGGGGLYDPDAYWPEDVLFMERNSRDFAARIDRINTNAAALCALLQAHPDVVRQLYYPAVEGPSHAHYEACRVLPAGGYGGLLSFSCHRKQQAVALYDALATAKGPSLGTNFTLTSPYVVLAHYQELDWCAGLGVDPDLLRVSVGLEDTAELVRVFEVALAAAAQAPGGGVVDGKEATAAVDSKP
ncbi:cystathionine gamma-synthase [Niveomyces insectorum RCEF 264]|uniref:Cystathionine gamma-synthase n=1 Tax=Niveomyces insectorum RCEF 264 TaxID=1081102 RepID=A0A167MLV1_9HYPO|nr:cystathionine gamma-synthase [Niveomyces insectorum RCEF 264]